jgi:hypothetical protein
MSLKSQKTAFFTFFAVRTQDLLQAKLFTPSHPSYLLTIDFSTIPSSTPRCSK